MQMVLQIKSTEDYIVNIWRQEFGFFWYKTLVSVKCFFVLFCFYGFVLFCFQGEGKKEGGEGGRQRASVLDWEFWDLYHRR